MSDKYNFHSGKQSTENKFHKLKKLMEELDMKNIIMYCEEGVMTFGNPALLLALYVHHDKQFNDDTMPMILKELDEDMVQHIVEQASHKH